MKKYILSRFGQSVVVVFLTYTVTFLLVQLAPANAIEIRLSDPDNSIPPEQVDALYTYYGLDRSIFYQYIVGVGRLLQGDLGFSVTTGQPVTERLLAAVPATLQLTGSALTIALVLAFVLVTVSSLTDWYWLRSLLDLTPSLFVSVPTFWLGLIVIQFFSFQLNWFSVVETGSSGGLVFAAIALAIPVSAPIARVLDAGVHSARSEPYMNVLYTKGVSRARAYFGHALRSALLPALTIAGLALGELLAGAVVIETVFARQGLGGVTERAVTGQDLPVIQGVVVLSAVVFVVVGFVSDMLYLTLDPRVRLQARRRPKVDAIQETMI
ncbi:hypothetical protein CH267_12950 [Rhodococcus sp. 06-621-2]|nr:ABC transporter permease [Rhodococcus sp. 06-621-2]OZC55482.1 hypothetical protein CH267_12950 [Rhodococcus sp. 06-621-2]